MNYMGASLNKKSQQSNTVYTATPNNFILLKVTSRHLRKTSQSNFGSGKTKEECHFLEMQAHTSKLYFRRRAIRDPTEKQGARLLELNNETPRK